MLDHAGFGRGRSAFSDMKVFLACRTIHRKRKRRRRSAFMGPLCGGEVGSIGPQGDRQGCRFLFVRAGALSKSPAAPHGLAGQGRPASAKRGGLLFWLLFSWPRKRKVTRPPVADESPRQASQITRTIGCRQIRLYQPRAKNERNASTTLSTPSSSTSR